MSKRQVSEGSVSLGQATVLAKTDRALLCKLDSGEEEWFPISQIHDDSEVYDEVEVGGSGELVITAWLAEKKGLG